MKKFNMILSIMMAMMISFLAGIYAAPTIQKNVFGKPAAAEEATGTAGVKETGTNAGASDTNSGSAKSEQNSADAKQKQGDSNSAKVVTGGEIGEPLTFNYSINSADGVKLTWEAKNLTGKTINYYTVVISTFNPVGDPSYDQMSDESTFKLKVVGPVKPDETLLLFDLFTYQGALHTIKIDKILLEYDDGTTETIDYGYETSDSSGL
ncbi:hypothetical protein [Paenibacillus sanfengchensis]|uniref:hypothetical protein n=1 Tax=Paenibacillus sanfengchensis TaxID=3119819 RepID=UPI002FE29ED4